MGSRKKTPDISGHGQDRFEHVQNSCGRTTINFSRTRVFMPSYCSRDGSREESGMIIDSRGLL